MKIEHKLIAFNQDPTEPPVLTAEEFADYLDLSVITFNEYRRQGLGPEHIRQLDDDGRPLFYRVGGEVYYTLWGLSVWNQLRRDGDIVLA